MTQIIDIFEDDMRKARLSVQLLEEELDSDVYTCYIEAEKILRIFSNLLHNQMSRSVEQLKHAGHCVLEDRPEHALVHCKYAIQIALDFYVRATTQRYEDVCSCLSSQEQEVLLLEFSLHIKKISAARSTSLQSSFFYSAIYEAINDGIDFYLTLSKYRKVAGLARGVFDGKLEVYRKNEQLKLQYSALKDEVSLQQIILNDVCNSRVAVLTILITCFLVFVMTLFVGVITTNNHLKLNSVLMLNQSE